MKALLPILLLTLVLAATTSGDGIEGCTGHESQFALGEEKPELVATVANGKKYTIGMCITTLRLRREEVLHRFSQGDSLRDGIGLRDPHERRAQDHGA